MSYMSKIKLAKVFRRKNLQSEDEFIKNFLQKIRNGIERGLILTRN